MVASGPHGFVLADRTERIRGNGRLQFAVALPPSLRGGVRVRISAQQHTDAAQIKVKLRRAGGELRPIRRVARYMRLA